MDDAMNKTGRLKDLALLAMRMALAIVLIYACLDKIANPEGFAASVKNYQFLPVILNNFFAMTMPWAELFCGILLLAGLFERGAGLITSLMFLAFLIALTSALLRGLDISCGCFHQAETETITWLYLLRDLGLLILCLPITRWGGGRFSLRALVSRNR